MIQKFVHRMMLRRHYWREVRFDELSELYTSMLLRSLASNVLFVFIPLFMFQNGYSIQLIFAMFGCYFVARIFADVAGGFVVARFGPKHTQIASSVLQILSAAQFMTIPTFHWSILQLGAVWGISASLFFIAYHVQFSKIKHTKHAGKELGYMNVMDKVGALLGPLLGGVIGTLVGSRYIFAAASVMMLLSLWPLFLTQEPVKIRQKLAFTTLPLHKIKRDLFSYSALGIENSFCVGLWPLYVAIFVLAQGSAAYAQLGVLSAFSVIVAVVSAYGIGKLIDRRNARQILRTAALLNAIVYLFRPFVTTPSAVLATNIANEAVTNAYRMPYTKGMYAAADDLPGSRIAYIVTMEVIGSITKGTAWLLLAILAFAIEPKQVIFIGFLIAAMASLLVMTERYKALEAR